MKGHLIGKRVLGVELITNASNGRAITIAPVNGSDFQLAFIDEHTDATCFELYSNRSQLLNRVEKLLHL